MARPAGLAPAYLRSTGGRFDYFIFGRIGQVGRNCTDFPGFTGRCPANWATHLKSGRSGVTRTRVVSVPRRVPDF